MPVDQKKLAAVADAVMKTCKRADADNTSGDAATYDVYDKQGTKLGRIVSTNGEDKALKDAKVKFGSTAYRID